MWISSDAESGSDIDDMDSSNGCWDADDRRSDDALSSVNAPVASITKPPPGMLTIIVNSRNTLPGRPDMANWCHQRASAMSWMMVLAICASWVR